MKKYFCKKILTAVLSLMSEFAPVDNSSKA